MTNRHHRQTAKIYYPRLETLVKEKHCLLSRNFFLKAPVQPEKRSPSVGRGFEHFLVCTKNLDSWWRCFFPGNWSATQSSFWMWKFKCSISAIPPTFVFLNFIRSCLVFLMLILETQPYTPDHLGNPLVATSFSLCERSTGYQHVRSFGDRVAKIENEIWSNA